MRQYLQLVDQIMARGSDRTDRTGTGTRSIFGYQMKFGLSVGFPLVSVKSTWFKGVVHELLWMIKGDTNIKYLTDNDVHIWDEWADKNGDLGPVYGAQWRNWRGSVVSADPVFTHKSPDGSSLHGDVKLAYEAVDQLGNAIKMIKEDPNSRRIIVNSWDPGRLSEMALPPCHMFFQFYVEKGKLSCLMYQRSADVFLGVPFNIASYALLTHLVAQVTGLEVGTFTHTIGDAHIYKNHFDQAYEMLDRIPKERPKLVLNPDIKNIDEFTYSDISLVGYDPHPAIKAKVSV